MVCGTPCPFYFVRHSSFSTVFWTQKNRIKGYHVIGAGTCICPGQTVNDGANKCACPGDTVKDGADNCNCPGQTENDGSNNCITISSK